MGKYKKIQVSVKTLKNPLHFFALGFGTGLLTKAPGTMGTLVGVLIYILLPSNNLILYFVIIISFFIFGIFCCDYTGKYLDNHDHPSIVWDEIVGYLVTMIMVPRDWIWILLGFVLFRAFDIIKPWPISLVDRKIQNGLGTMLDDFVAGIFSLIVIHVIINLIEFI